MARAERQGRGPAYSALASGILRLILAKALGTALVGFPFEAYAIVRGWLSDRERRADGNSGGVRRARWGAGLGCAGFLYLSRFCIIVGGLLIAGSLSRSARCQEYPSHEL